MRLWMMIFGGLAFTAYAGLTASAQNAVVNPLFQTGDLQYWKGNDSSLKVIPSPANLGMTGYCVRKWPGLPDNNGAVTQQVHLLGNTTYKFQARITAEYCSS